MEWWGQGFNFAIGMRWDQQPAHTFCSVLPLHTSWRGRMDARVRRLPGGSHFLEVLAPYAATDERLLTVRAAPAMASLKVLKEMR